MPFSKRIYFYSLYLGLVFSLFPFLHHWQDYHFQIVKFQQVENQTSDEREKKIAALHHFLEERNSPLAPYAPQFVEAADEYHLPWTLLPAIAGKESSFGKHVPYVRGRNSYNPFGWGVTKGQVIVFNSWSEAIWTVGAGLRRSYLNHGLIHLASIERRYNPISYHSNHNWRRGVEYLSWLLEEKLRFEQSLSYRISDDSVFDPQAVDVLPWVL